MAATLRRVRVGRAATPTRPSRSSYSSISATRRPSAAIWRQSNARDLEDSTVATDGETIVFGAPNATVDGLAAAGAVYVLDRDGQLLARLTSPNAAANARFGAAVAVDGETIVVGAPQEPTRYNNAAAVATVGGQRVSHGGAVYVFERPSRGWKSNSSPRGDDRGARGR